MISYDSYKFDPNIHVKKKNNSKKAPIVCTRGTSVAKITVEIPKIN
jgi:hypothetical protein